MDSSIPFERYDEEFSSLLKQVQDALDEEPPSQYTQNLLQQCDDLLKQMALEARSVESGGDRKRMLLDKVRACKSQYQAVLQQSERQGLLGSNGSGSMKGNDPQSKQARRMMQDNEDMLATQNDRLERARRTMQETESVALEITEELGQNREKLLSAHGRVREVQGLTGRARRILNSMNQRAVQQKLILYAVATSLVIVFFLLLWMMWRR